MSLRIVDYMRHKPYLDAHDSSFNGPAARVSPRIRFDPVAGPERARRSGREQNVFTPGSLADRGRETLSDDGERGPGRGAGHFERPARADGRADRGPTLPEAGEDAARDFQDAP